MPKSDRVVAGALLFVGGAQFVVALIVAEAVYPSYSVSANFISDLGVGPAASIFNSSIVILGLLGLAGAYFIQRSFRKMLVSILFFVASAGVAGVGVFPETFGLIHSVVSLIAFLFSGSSAIAAATLQRPPLAYFSVILGVSALLALALFGARIFLGLGPGGMERMIAYPVLLWLVGFGASLMTPLSQTSPST
jgi:hypothetical membrane protein